MIIVGIFLAVLPWLIPQWPGRLAALGQKPRVNRAISPSVPIIVVLELLAAALHTGVSIPRALKTVGAAIGGVDGPVLLQVGRQLELGASWNQAWRKARVELQTIGTALRPAWEAGASPTASLRAAGETSQRHQLEQSKLAAARLGVQLVLPLGLCLLPAFVLIGLVPVLLSLGAGLFG